MLYVYLRSYMLWIWYYYLLIILFRNGIEGAVRWVI